MQDILYFAEQCLHNAAGLIQDVLRLDLDKNISIRCSNWETCPLTPEQKSYAATDAYASIKLHQVDC